jgi:hypothetical protein
MMKWFPLLLAFMTASANAISIAQRDSLDSMCKKAPYILQATIADAELIAAPKPDMAPTMCYALRDIGPLKGVLANPTVAKLCYLGDVVSQTHLIVAGLRYPKVGEQGIFFVKDFNDLNSISPLQGWNQGHIAISGQGGSPMFVESAMGSAICAGGMNGKLSNADTDTVFDLNLEESGKACQKLTLESFVNRIKSCAGGK